MKAADSILSSKLDFLSLKIVIQDLEKLILAVNSSQWERISVKRWILKLVPKALKADKVSNQQTYFHFNIPVFIIYFLGFYSHTCRFMC